MPTISRLDILQLWQEELLILPTGAQDQWNRFKRIQLCSGKDQNKNICLEIHSNWHAKVIIIYKNKFFENIYFRRKLNLFWGWGMKLGNAKCAEWKIWSIRSLWKWTSTSTQNMLIQIEIKFDQHSYRTIEEKSRIIRKECLQVLLSKFW